MRYARDTLDESLSPFGDPDRLAEWRARLHRQAYLAGFTDDAHRTDLVGYAVGRRRLELYAQTLGGAAVWITSEDSRLEHKKAAAVLRGHRAAPLLVVVSDDHGAGTSHPAHLHPRLLEAARRRGDLLVLWSAGQHDAGEGAIIGALRAGRTVWLFEIDGTQEAVDRYHRALADARGVQLVVGPRAPRAGRG